MIDTEKKVLEGFLSKTLKMDTEDVASLYNDAGELVSLTAAAKADEVRIEKLQNNSGDQYKRGVKEGASKLEKALKEKYDIDSDQTGVDLFDEVLSAKIEAVKTDVSDISKHPDFLKREIEFGKSMRQKDKEWQEKIDAKDKESERQAIFSEVAKKALIKLEGKTPLLPKDPQKAQKWKDRYLDEFKGFDYRKDDKDFVVIKNGEPYKDSHGNIIYLDDLIESTASDNFEFPTAEQRSAAGNQSADSQNIVAPKTKDEYIAQSKAAKTPEERIKIMESYEKTKVK